MFRARYRRIIFFFGRVILSFIYWDLILPRIGFQNWANKTRSKRIRRSSAAFRSLAVQMGGVHIKVGQFLSSRVDVLPAEVIEELEGLQDEVPAESMDSIRVVVEGEFGAPLEEKYAFFDPKPLAAASLGQVHRAKLHIEPENQSNHEIYASFPCDEIGCDVVVKVQRLNIEKIISTDLAAFRTVGAWLNRYKPIRRRANIPALIREFTRILYEEIDYLAEGRNAETFAANFECNRRVRVPKVVWTHTTRRALTLENVWAIKITDYDEITQAGISRADVASNLLNIYLKQIFEDGFFHADPHPGNLFVNPHVRKSSSSRLDGIDWELTFVDFGMVGRVPSDLRNGLRELLIGIGTRDSSRVIKAYQMMAASRSRLRTNRASGGNGV